MNRLIWAKKIATWILFLFFSLPVVTFWLVENSMIRYQSIIWREVYGTGVYEGFYNLSDFIIWFVDFLFFAAEFDAPHRTIHSQRKRSKSGVRSVIWCKNNLICLPFEFYIQIFYFFFAYGNIFFYWWPDRCT